MYFSITFKFRVAIALLVVMIIPLLSRWMKSAETSDFTSFKGLLMFETCIFA